MPLILAALALAGTASAPPADDDAPPAPMDLVWETTDVNGVAANPKWGLQVTEPGSLPDVAEICFTVPGGFDNPLCSTQHPASDTAVGIRRLICEIGATTPIAGHVNWYPGTFEGPIYWDSLSFVDRDVNVRLVPPEQNAFTSANPDSIKGEFDSRETLVHFATPWWTSFRKANDAGRKELIDGRPAIVSGFTSVDCEHSCRSELHPVWVLAIHVKDDPEDDVWAVFARNWGNEGFCASAQHLVSWPDDRFTLTLPWRDGATAVDLAGATQFLANVDGVAGSWSPVAGERVSLTLALPPPSAGARVHGDLHLRWSGSTVAGTRGPLRPLPAGFVWESQGGEAEERIAEIVEKLPATMQAALEHQLVETRPFLDRVPVTLVRADAGGGADSSSVSTVTTVPDPARTAQTERFLRALVNANGGKLPFPLGDALAPMDTKPGSPDRR